MNIDRTNAFLMSKHFSGSNFRCNFPEWQAMGDSAGGCHLSRRRERDAKAVFQTLTALYVNYKVSALDKYELTTIYIK